MKISSSMTRLLSTLVVFSLLLGYAAASLARRPNVVSRYGQSPTPPAAPVPPSDDNGGGGGDEYSKIMPKKPRRSGGFLGGLIGFPWFGKKQPPEQPPPEEEDPIAIRPPEEWEATKTTGTWELHSENAGVSAMHIQLMPNGNKIVWFDSTSNGLSDIRLDPPSCKPRYGGKDTDPQQDCTAHAIEYDFETADVRTLKVESSPWCSSGALSRTGNLISTGGDKDGFRAVRMLEPCKDCDFKENPTGLFATRWYATQHALEDGSIVVMGGRNSYNYEIIPPDSLEFTPKMMELPLLEESSDDGGRENNLYPFVNLLPDGNLFVFANYKSIILNPLTGETVRKLPDLPGGSRNYPPSGMSALLPINLDTPDDAIHTEVIVCGGNTREAYTLSDLEQPKRTFLPASKDCGRLVLSKEGAEWEKEDMPSPRVMGDMLLLPNGNILMINGAKAGTSAWDAAKDPNLTPVLYIPNEEKGKRFKELAPSKIPRMYHSSSAVLPDGKILVAGSNTNGYYKLRNSVEKFEYPTELRVEKFSPPYLDQEVAKYRLAIKEGTSDKELKYGVEFNVEIEKGIQEKFDKSDIKVTMYSPPFTTHGYSMNQRLLILKVKNVNKEKITVVAPPSGKLAPPGYYLLFVVHRGVPSPGMWVKIE